ncbi:MAG: hypothetical protein ACRD7E_33170 [Bryobacteraceae bacterium]
MTRFQTAAVLAATLSAAFLWLALWPAAAAAQMPKRPAEPGAKVYEMTTYHVGLLFRGPKWTPESTPETRRIQEGHMANIRKMAESGKLIVAGPFGGNGNLRGMFIFEAGRWTRSKLWSKPTRR